LVAAVTWLAALVGPAALGGCSEAPPAKPAPRYLSISGLGSTIATPDAVSYTATVRRRGETAAAALAAAAQTIQAIRDHLGQNGVAASDSRLTTWVHPFPRCPDVRVREPDGRRTNAKRFSCEQREFEATQTIQAMVRDGPKAGALMAQSIALGAGEASAGEPVFADPANLQETARRAAIADATAKAQLYAARLGVQLGPVHAVTDDPLFLPDQHRETLNDPGAKASLDAPPPVPLEPGQRIITRTLYVTWELR
jgi:uncharacterized protein